MTTNPSTPLRTVRGTVPEADYDFLIRHLCGGEHGLQSEVVGHLFCTFVAYLRYLNLEPYGTNPNTPKRVRRLLRTTTWLALRQFISRTTDVRLDPEALGRLDR